MSQRLAYDSRALFERLPDIPDPATFNFAELTRRGARGVLLEQPIDLTGAGPERVMRLLQMLRQAAGAGLRVDWCGALDPPIADRVRHLDPPRTPDGRRQWAAPRRPLLTAKYGPGFVLIDDQRDGTGFRLLTDQDEVRTLVAYAVPRPVSAQDPRAAVEQLCRRGYLLDVDGWCVTLPVRLRFARRSPRYPAAASISPNGRLV